MFLHCQVSRCLGEKLFWNDVPEKFLSKLIALISDFCLSQVLLYWLFKWQFSYFIFLSALRNLFFTANVYVHAMCVPVWADGFLIYSMRYNHFLSSYLDVQVALGLDAETTVKLDLVLFVHIPIIPVQGHPGLCWSLPQYWNQSVLQESLICFWNHDLILSESTTACYLLSSPSL